MGTAGGAGSSDGAGGTPARSGGGDQVPRWHGTGSPSHRPRWPWAGGEGWRYPLGDGEVTAGPCDNGDELSPGFLPRSAGSSAPLSPGPPQLSPLSPGPPLTQLSPPFPGPPPLIVTPIPQPYCHLCPHLTVPPSLRPPLSQLSPPPLVSSFSLWPPLSQTSPLSPGPPCPVCPPSPQGHPCPKCPPCPQGHPVPIVPPNTVVVHY